MRPGQLTPNEFEMAVLARIAQKNPSLEPKIHALHVLSRKFTGVGCYTDFLVSESAPEHEDQSFGFDELISMPGVQNGMGATLNCKGEEPERLEIYAFGNDHWDGVYDGFNL